jgi:hypothetical protein
VGIRICYLIDDWLRWKDGWIDGDFTYDLGDEKLYVWKGENEQF